MSAFKVLLNILSENTPEVNKKINKLKLENRPLLCLIEIKCNLTFPALAVLFSERRTTVSNIFYAVLMTLLQACKNFIYWPQKEVVQETILDCFEPDYKNFRIIINSTEFVVE